MMDHFTKLMREGYLETFQKELAFQVSHKEQFLFHVADPPFTETFGNSICCERAD